METLVSNKWRVIFISPRNFCADQLSKLANLSIRLLEIVLVSGFMEIDLIAPWEKLKKKILSLRVKGKICGRLLSP